MIAHPALENLSPRRQKFAIAMALSGNQSEAARQAGYEPRSAYNTGYRLMSNDDVRAAVDAIHAMQLNAEDIDASFVIKSLAKEATSKEVSDATRVAALKLIGQWRGLFKEVRVHETAEISDKQIIARLMEAGLTEKQARIELGLDPKELEHTAVPEAESDKSAPENG